ncbi:uncharacterized protein LOC134224250 [Armigeres subalbatus]|uniref:uncharacterized protein LOC134224250 n=1 Tax=Armigeres subalbatus TaxID=124917 RepID=UPI002ED38FB1
MKRFLAFLFFMPFVPVMALVASVFQVYRFILSCVLRLTHGDKFVGMMDGRDAIWGLEEQKNCGVVNIVAFVEDTVVNNEDDLPEKLRRVFVQRFNNLISNKQDQFRKGMLRRNCASGYYYWTDDLNLEACDLIKLVEPTTNKAYISELELRELASQITTSKLPSNHGALWEILILTKPVLELGSILKYPIFLRFHHSMGDGVAILRFVMEEIMNPTDEWIFSPKHLANSNFNFSKSLSFWLKVIYEFPNQMLHVLQMKADRSSLNTDNLTPFKITCWQNESTVLKNTHWLQLLEKVHIKQSTVANSSVFITALSGTLHKYFEARDENPGSLTIAIPVRTKHEEARLKLENAFATPVERVPITPNVLPDDPDRQQKLLDKLTAIKKITKVLRSRTNLMIIFLAAISLAATFPTQILKYISKFFHITASVSVMPVLKTNLQVGSYELKNMIFWPPAFGTVGLNVSVFVYGNQLQLALLADRSVLGTVEEGMALLEQIMHEIKRMDMLMGE